MSASPLFGRRAAIAGVGLVIAACLVGIWLLSADARREIDALATANADSAQWSVAQSEVELLTLETAIRAALQSDTDPALQTVRRRFDVFYSRMQTLRNSRFFPRLTERAAVREAFGQVTDFLDRTVPLIDGPDADLQAHLGDLVRDITEVRRSLRVVTLASVRLFTQDAATQRAEVSNALMDLAILMVVLVVVLVGAVLALLWSLATGRRQTAAISRAQTRARTIIDTALDGVLVVGRDGRILDFNSAAERMFGHSQDVARSLRLTDLVSSGSSGWADNPAIADQPDTDTETPPDTTLDTGLAQGLNAGLVQLQARDRAGRVFPVELSIAAADSAEEEILVAFVRDISTRIAAERDLVAARDRALAGEKAKAEFLAVMSHEMRTPLNGVLGSLDLLSETDLSERQRRLVEVMASSGRMLLEHVNTVLDIARADAGRTVLRRDRFDPVALLEDVIANQSVQAGARGNEIVLRSPVGADIGMVLGDGMRLRQILVNLVANAVKFTRDGTITLKVARVTGGAEIDFSVTDTGPGIAAADQARIFEDFVTLDSSYAREVEGTGLGLGIVRRLAKAMGGAIWVESDPGQGATFTLRVPLPRSGPRSGPQSAESGAAGATPHEAQVPDTLARQDRVGAGASVLIVEDNEINRLIVREMLTALGCSTRECGDGRQGVDCAARQGFDLIMMDISMPHLDGVAAARMIRAGDGPNATTPIVALTAHASASDIRRFHEAGMDAVVVKPLSMARMAELLAEMLPALDRAQGPSTPGDEAPLTLLAPDQARDTRARALRELGRDLALISTLLDREGDLADIAALAHRATGLAAVVGITELHDALVSVDLAMAELDGEAGEHAALAEMVAEARHLLDIETDRHRAGAP